MDSEAGASSGSSLRDVRLIAEAVLFTALVPGTVIVWIPWWILAATDRLVPFSGSVHQVVALATAAAGGFVYLWCLKDFVARGRGIPAPIDHPKQLVVTGLYRYVRNPMYVGVLLILIGEVLFFGSTALLLYAVGWFLIVNLVVLLYEEPTLRRKFGTSYERYASSVGRWFPRVHGGGPDPGARLS